MLDLVLLLLESTYQRLHSRRAYEVFLQIQMLCILANVRNQVTGTFVRNPVFFQVKVLKVGQVIRGASNYRTVFVSKPEFSQSKVPEIVVFLYDAKSARQKQLFFRFLKHHYLRWVWLFQKLIGLNNPSKAFIVLVIFFYGSFEVEFSIVENSVVFK